LEERRDKRKRRRAQSTLNRWRSHRTITLKADGVISFSLLSSDKKMALLIGIEQGQAAQ
jgi:hypothetical protein